MAPRQGIYFSTSFPIHLKGFADYIGLAVQIQEGLFLATMYFLEMHSSRESPKNNQQFLDLV